MIALTVMVISVATPALAASPVTDTTQPQVSPSVQDTLLAVCEQHGYGDDCARVLLGIMWKESKNVSHAIGDHGEARGYFQIHYKLHKVSLDCAYDLTCSADWTLSHLERKGYPKYVAYAVQCHNGCDVDNGYAAAALRNGDKLWSTPMQVEVLADAQTVK